MKDLLMKIESLSDYYLSMMKQETRSYIMAGGDANKILDSWWLSLIFFFDRVFYQGRRDEVSTMFKEATIIALEEFLGKTEQEKLSQLIRLKDNGCLDYHSYGFGDKVVARLPSLCSELKAKLNGKYFVQLPNGNKKERSTGKARDREMTIDTLRFLTENLEKHDFNILKYTISQIRDHGLNRLYGQLTDIRQVGDKTARLFLRDAVAVYDLEKLELDVEELSLLQPVDTWVRQICRSSQVKLVSKDTSDREIQKKIVKLCLDMGVSPIKFNQGIWYLGSHSLELLLNGFSL